MIVENHPSSLGSLIALEMTSKAAPDGYTLHLTTSSGMVNAILVTKVPYNVRAAIAPIAQLTLQPYVLTVHQAVPAASLKEFIAYAKSKKGTLNYGSTGSGSTTHLGMELLKSLAGMEMQHIPYKGGGQVLTDIVAGRIEVMFSSPITASTQVKAGKLRLLAIGSARRSKLLPDIPTVAESGLPGFELTGWYGLIAPVGTPAAIVTALNREAVQIMNSPDIQAKLAADGSEAPDPHTPAEFAKIISSEIDIWEKVIRTSNIKLDN
jgi:tripartite-type tricarboxylate transporter receptor subunit TctC